MPDRAEAPAARPGRLRRAIEAAVFWANGLLMLLYVNGLFLLTLWFGHMAEPDEQTVDSDMMFLAVAEGLVLLLLASLILVRRLMRRGRRLGYGLFGVPVAFHALTAYSFLSSMPVYWFIGAIAAPLAAAGLWLIVAGLARPRPSAPASS